MAGTAPQMRRGIVGFVARNLAINAVIGVLAAIGLSLLLTWFSHLPRVSPVSLAAACESANTITTGIWVFALIFPARIIYVILRELRRRVIHPNQTQSQFSLRFLLTLTLIVAVFFGLARVLLR